MPKGQPGKAGKKACPKQGQGPMRRKGMPEEMPEDMGKKGGAKKPK